MKKLQCELCGSTDFIKNGDYFVCEHCGCKYTKEDAQILISGAVKVEGPVDVSGSTVKLDKEDAYEVGRKLEEGRIQALQERAIEAQKQRIQQNKKSGAFGAGCTFFILAAINLLAFWSSNYYYFFLIWFLIWGGLGIALIVSYIRQK